MSSAIGVGAIGAGARAARSVEEWLGEAQAREQAGHLDEAEHLLGQIITAEPDCHPALHQAGLLAYKRGRMQEAVSRLERAIAAESGIALYHRNICELYRSLSRLDEAVFHGRRAVELTPDDAGAQYNLGVIHYDRLEIDEAIAAERRALALDPSSASAHFELAESLLLTGQFDEGWREYEWRFRLPNAPPLLPPNDRPLWDGRPMASSTLMLIGDQGFGDTIQFARYIPLVAERCPNLIMACSSEMQPIVTQQTGIRHYYDRWEMMPSFDAYCPLSGLPRLFGTDLTSIPAPIPYVRADPAKAAHWRQRLDRLIPRGYRRIGLVWAGRPTHGNDFNRSATLAALSALAELNGVALISLQMGPAQAQIGRYWARAPLVNLGREIADFTDTMAILDGLDRLVTVDTGVAHLAGAMGKPVSVLLPFAPDWRWMLGRTDSPWYPTFELFRQTEPGRWDGAVEAIVKKLRA